MMSGVAASVATAGLRVLLVEDNPDDRVLVTRVLRREFEDCSIEVVSDRSDLDVALELGQFDVVITDYGLGWTRGLVVVRKLKSRFPRVPVIMWSGTAGETVAVEAMREGVEDFVLKSPEHISNLVLAVRTAVGGAAERQATIEAETRYRRLFENLTLGHFVAARDGTILEANPSLASILGLADAADLVGQTMVDFWVDPAARARWLKTVIERGVVNDCEVQFKRADDDVIWVRIQARALRDESGHATGSEGVVEDVTGRIRGDEDRRKLLAKLVNSQEEERQRIASDIHDDSIQVMTAVGMRLHSIERKVTDPELIETLIKLEGIVDLSIERLRHQLFELRPPSLDREGIGSALQLYLEQMQEAGGPSFQLEDLLPVEPPPEVRATIYRIAQEILTNVRKHARASLVTVTLEGHADGVLVHVVDDGAGFIVVAQSRPRPGHLGLTAIRERAEMAGGWSEIQSEPGEGTTVRFWIPVREELVEEGSSDD